MIPRTHVIILIILFKADGPIAAKCVRIVSGSRGLTRGGEWGGETGTGGNRGAVSELIVVKGSSLVGRSELNGMLWFLSLRKQNVIRCVKYPQQ